MAAIVLLRIRNVLFHLKNLSLEEFGLTHPIYLYYLVHTDITLKIVDLDLDVCVCVEGETEIEIAA